MIANRSVADSKRLFLILKEYFEDLPILKSDFDRESYRFEMDLTVEDTEEEKDVEVTAVVKVLRGEVSIVSVEEK